MTADGRVVAAGDHREQARVSLANLLAELGYRGCGPGDLVRTTVYVVCVAVLGYPGQLVEIDAIAAVPVSTGPGP